MPLLSDERISDLYTRKGDRQHVEYLWQLYEPYAERDFLKNYHEHHAQRYAEMYLGAVLVQQGIPVIPQQARPRQAGPDFCIKHEGGHMWIESIAPTMGSGPDSVPDYKNDRKVHNVPHEEVKLRYTSAFETKYRKYENYWSNGWVSTDSVCIIAINSGFIPNKFTELNIPRIAQVLYGGGWPQVTLDRETLEVVKEDYQEQRDMVKAYGARISSRLFLEERHSGISAVIFAYADPYNHPESLGTDILICHNPHATNRLDIGWLGVGRDCCWTPTETGGRIDFIKHNKGDGE